MKYIIWVAVLVVLVAGLILITKKSASEQENRTEDESGALRLGSVLPLTGDLAFYGEEAQKGIQIAIDEMEKEGMKVVYASENNEYSLAKTVAAASKLAATDDADAVIFLGAAEMGAATKVANETKTPSLVLLDSNETLKQAGQYVFSAGYSNEYSGAIVADHAFTVDGIKSMAVIRHQDNAVEIFADAFVKRFTSLGGTIVLDSSASPTERDYRGFLAKAKQNNVEGIYMGALPPGNSIILRQAAELGLTVKFYATDGFIDDEIIAAGPAAEGVVFPSSYVEESEGFMAKYKEKYGVEPPTVLYSSLGYAGAKIIAEAKKISMAEHISLIDALARVDIVVNGSRLNFAGRQVLDRHEKLFVVKDGKAVEIK